MSNASAQQTADWFSSQQKYWDSWFEQQRKFFNATGETSTQFQGPQGQWADLLKGWQNTVFSGGKTTSDTDAFRQYFTNAGQTYLNMMQQFYQGTGQSKPLEQMTKEWTENLQKFFSGSMQSGKDPFAALDPMNFFTSFPGIGYTREKQEQLNHLYQQWAEYEAKSREYTASMAKVGLEAVEKFREYVMHPPEGAAPLTSLKEVYAKWVDVCEDIYAKYAMSEEYTTLYGEVVNALMAFRKRQNEFTDDIIGKTNMPTRAEVDSLHKRMQELKREVSALRTELGRKPAQQAAQKTPKAAAAPVAKKGKKK